MQNIRDPTRPFPNQVKGIRPVQGQTNSQGIALQSLMFVRQSRQAVCIQTFSEKAGKHDAICTLTAK